jgi:hypothetical protein
MHAEKTESGAIAFLKKALIATLIFIVSVPLGVFLQQAWMSFHLGDHEVTFPAAPWVWFVAGVVFALFVYALIDLFRDQRKRIERGKQPKSTLKGQIS